MRPGDVISDINQRRVADATGLHALRADPPRQLLLTVVHDGRGYYIMAE